MAGSSPAKGINLSYLQLAFWLLCAAVLMGSGLAIPYMRGAPGRPPWPISAAHGATGAFGLAMLLLVLWRGLPPSELGTGGFAPAAALLLALALAIGLVFALHRRRPAGVVVAVHASLAIAGFVVLWTVVSLG